ncbi:MAG: hypothetical protein ACI8R4_002099 [Paracoccaceae bacterium]|jgi:hypothetical protein
MHPNQPRLRHAQLFELLRQQNMSEKTTTRLRVREFARTQIDQDEAAMLRALAVNSWGPAVPADRRV